MIAAAAALWLVVPAIAPFDAKAVLALPFTAAA
jgi:hypothetical protein